LAVLFLYFISIYSIILNVKANELGGAQLRMKIDASWNLLQSAETLQRNVLAFNL